MKTLLTIEIENRLDNYLTKQRVFHCNEVTIGWHGKQRVDWMSYDTHGIIKCFEIKTSKADFHSKAENTFVGHYNYYVMPKELYEQVKDDIPKHLGVLVDDGIMRKAYQRLQSIKPAKELIIHNEEILKEYLIRSLSREAKKYRKLDKTK